MTEKNPLAAAKPEPYVKPALEHKHEPAIHDEEKKKLLQMSEISLWLDTYDDIFSDFDPRPYSERALSDDFLAESKKAAREKTSGTIDLKCLIPVGKQDPKLEETIKKRLHEHFRKHHQLLLNDVSRFKHQGVAFFLLGMSMMMASTYIRSLSETDFLYQFLFVFLEPSGWFTTWYGLDQIFYNTRQLKPELDFYAKMSRCEIHFMPY